MVEQCALYRFWKIKERQYLIQKLHLFQHYESLIQIELKAEIMLLKKFISKMILH